MAKDVKMEQSEESLPALNYCLSILDTSDRHLYMSIITAMQHNIYN
jgi:hypothetical protein